MITIRRREPCSAATLPADLHPLLRRILAARQINTAEDMLLDMQRLLAPGLLKGIDQAVALLERHLHTQSRLLIVSDFDADGATSCALGLRALRALGFSHVDFIVPNRFTYGYGLTPGIVELARERKPDLIITVDNGISSVEGVEAAHQHGIEVLITDHHLPGAQLPAAEAIINPNQKDCRFPSKALAGVGVIFYLMLALRARLREQGWFADNAVTEPNMAALLDLVALGTVADVVPLDRNNRILVNEGLRRIRAGRACPGITALLEAGGRDFSAVVAADLGFAAGPRLNAAGRLDDMTLGINCLLADDLSQARSIAARLNAINEERKEIESRMRDEATEALRRMHLETDSLPAGLCIYDPSWHQGVVGILASRLKEQLHRPVIAFANAEVPSAAGIAEPQQQDPGAEIKGSARSIAGLHIRDVIETIATRNPGLISRFGGHAMAAGLSLKCSDFPRFAAAFSEEVSRLLTEDALRAVVMSDGEIDPADMSISMAQILRDAGPWGQSFPEPVFDGLFRVVQWRVLGGKHLKLVVSPQQCDLMVDAIAFNAASQESLHEGVGQLRLVYRLDINEYRGRRSLQLIVDHLEPG